MRATHMGMPDRLGAMGRECRRSPIPVILGRPMPVAAPDRLSAPASGDVLCVRDAYINARGPLDPKIERASDLHFLCSGGRI